MTQKLDVKGKNVLIISDLHSPFIHPDTYSFLQAIKDELKPDVVVSVGDEIDGASLSFHERDPDLPGPSDELKLAIEYLNPIYKMFPECLVMHSNHGSLVYRRGKFAGLPVEVFKSYREILQAPKGWEWMDDLILQTDRGPVYICHNRSSNVLQNAQRFGQSFVCGHFHGQFEIRYYSSPERLSYGMAVGCLINQHSRAFNYGKLSTIRPVIGVGMIMQGVPMLVSMFLNDEGRWIGHL